MPLLHVPADNGTAQSIGDLFAAWQPEPLLSLPLLVMGALYVIGTRRLARQRHQRREGASRQRVCFGVSYVALVLALLSPIHTFSDDLFFMHMLQHMLLISVAAPLLLLANPMQALIWSLTPRARRAVGRELSPEGSIPRMLRVLTHPALSWWIFALNLWLWHLPAAYQAALENQGLHYLQHGLFFSTAILFWWPVIGPAPLRSRLSYPLRMLYVFLAWLPNSLLGAIITFAPAPWLSFYTSRPRHWGIDALTDQQLAGLVMWIPGDLIYALAMLALLLATLRQEDRREAHTSALT